MISHGKDIKVFCGNANQPLAAEICQMMGTKLGESEVKSFADGEVIIAKTVKGKGVSFMENQAGWHGKAPNDEEFKIAMADLEKAGEALCQK